MAHADHPMVSRNAMIRWETTLLNTRELRRRVFATVKRGGSVLMRSAARDLYRDIGAHSLLSGQLWRWGASSNSFGTLEWGSDDGLLRHN